MLSTLHSPFAKPFLRFLDASVASLCRIPFVCSLASWSIPPYTHRTHLDSLQVMVSAHPKSGVVVLPKDLSRSSGTDTNLAVFIKPIKLPVNEEDKTIPLYIAGNNKHPAMVVELVKFVHTHGSWLLVPQDSALAPRFCSNGNITFVTKVDPLFAILIVMDCNSRSAETGVFQPLDTLCTTEGGLNLKPLSSEQQLSLLCDSKAVGGESFYRLNEQKVQSWILRKHDVLSRNPKVNAQHASDILCQYLNEKWAAIFRNALEAQAAIQNSSPVTESSADLAMSIMMNHAKENNIAAREPQLKGKRKPSRAGSATPSKKKKEVLNKEAAKWWASKRITSSSRKASSRKQTLRSSTTK